MRSTCKNWGKRWKYGVYAVFMAKTQVGIGLDFFLLAIARSYDYILCFSFNKKRLHFDDA